MASFIQFIHRGASAFAVLLGLSLADAAQAQVTVSVTGNVATAEVALPGGLGADFTMTFEGAENLSATSLGIGAKVVNLADPALLARLPAGTALATAFPVMISVEPPALGALTFRNAVSIELHTENLVFVPGSPFRLYKAPRGGQFYDITDSVLPGSVRTRGRTGDYSDFLVVIDLTTDVTDAIAKYDFITARLAHPSLSTAARNELLADLAASRALFDAGNYAGAANALNAFDAHLEARAGQGVPNVWRATRDLANIAGELIAESGTLRFTLGSL